MNRVRTVAPTWNLLLPARKANPYVIANKWRTRSLDRAAAQLDSATDPDEFYVEIVNLRPTPVTMILELAINGVARFRDALVLEPGNNTHRVPFARFGLHACALFGQSALLRLYPEADAEAHIVVRWLTFLRRAVKPQTALAAPELSQRAATKDLPAAKVKAVAWDLDNTVWRGVLGEMAEDEVHAEPNVVRLMQQLDARGILQSVVSKNDHEHAWAVLRRLGLAEFLLYPKINWNPKSANLRAIADDLNIGIDTFALIDDSIFERSEVATALPQVRVFDVADIDTLLERTEFDVPVTLEAQRRRKMYRVEEERKVAATAFAGDYATFLRDCAMVATLRPPLSAHDRERCHELIQRTNQLNTSGRRYSVEEFRELLADKSRVALSISCADRFGDYGLVGFVSMSFTADRTTVDDFVLSCRVAQKRVENAVFARLLGDAAKLGRREVALHFVPSARNRIMRESLQAVGFPIDASSTAPQLLALSTEHNVPEQDLVALKWVVGAAALDLGRAANERTG
jgi:FkbH-like protein